MTRASSSKGHRIVSKVEEEHARLMLVRELGVDFYVYDDGSRPSMPDLLSADGKHVAEVITTVPPAVREAEQRLAPLAEPSLSHCVWVVIPYTVLGGVTKDVRSRIGADVIRWVEEAASVFYWPSLNQHRSFDDRGPAPFLGLGAYDDGVRAMRVESCSHPDAKEHQIRWTVEHAPSSYDPWNLIRRSLRIVNTQQRGGAQALADKLNGHPNKHLIMYPFGPPGNLTAAFASFAPPPDPRDLIPPQLNAPLSDIHLWLMCKYGDQSITEGLHVCNGHWARFGTRLPGVDKISDLRTLHYREA